VLDQHGTVASEIKESYKAGDPIKLVWEGLPSNIDQLGTIRNVLRKLSHRYQIELNVVTDLEGFLFLGKVAKVSSAKILRRIFDRVKVHEWDKNTCASIITGCDIALIPIDCRNLGAMGKPENKLGLLWRMGMPVVTSATPAYTRAMNEAGQSLTCKDDAEWMSKLENLILDEQARRDAGERGRQYALRRFDEARIHDQWDAVFRSIGFEFSGAGRGT
jgi:glycosyltransferase involved in cell wall biosynthesis